MARNIVITGGSGGIGKRLVNYFNEGGDVVFSLSRTDGGAGNYYYCDVSDQSNVDNVFDEIGGKYKKIDLLILCSGIGLGGDIESTPADKVKQVFDVNFYGALYSVKAALKYMDRGGRIIFISSAAAFFALPYRSIYSASKAAVNILSAALAAELKGRGIGVSSICPGEIDNGFVANRLWHGDNSDKIKGLKERLKSKKRMDADKAAKKIFSITQKKHLRPMYIVGLKYKFFYLASKILPFRLMHKIINKKYG